MLWVRLVDGMRVLIKFMGLLLDYRVKNVVYILILIYNKWDIL